MNDKGFSLVEVVIAMLILTVGVLGLAATAGVVTRMTGQGGRLGGAAAVAGSRLERLRATPCASLASGAAGGGKYSESWTVTRVGLLVTVDLSVAYAGTQGTRTDRFATTISCAPS